MNISSCYFKTGKDNSNDPDAGNYTPPVIEASFIPSVKSGHVPLAVHFTDTSIGNIETFEWDFNGDGTVDSTERSPDHTFTLAGTYSVKLRITARQGLITDEYMEAIDVCFGVPERQTISNDSEGPYVIYPADLDNDGDIDIICGYVRDKYPQYNKISWWENIDNGTEWTEHIIADAGVSANLYIYSIHAADVNNDGYMDIIAAQYAANEIVWWENDGTPRDDTGGDGNSWTVHKVKTGFVHACSVYADDIDGDGDIDIAGAANGKYTDLAGTCENSEISWWENADLTPGSGDGNGSSWIEHNIKTDLGRASTVRIADIDGDGHRDIIAAIYGYPNYSSGEFEHSEILWFANTDGSGTGMTEHTIMPDSGPDYISGARDLYMADMDGDGDMDVLSAFWEGDEIVIWLNSGNGAAWTRRSIDMDFFGAQSVHAADIDGDGDMDVVGSSRIGDKIAWWENIGGRWDKWEEHAVDQEFKFASSAYAADINGDGLTDIAGAANGNYTTSAESCLAWWSVFMIDGE